MKRVYSCMLFPMLMLIAFTRISCQKKPEGRPMDSPGPDKFQPIAVPPQAMPVSLKVMTYNMHAGIGANGVPDLQWVADEIRNSNAAVIALNEVDKNYDLRSNYVDQPAWLASELGMHYVFQKTTWKAPNAASGNLPREFGHMVLSKYPIEANEQWIFTEFDTHYRGLLETRINVDGNTFHFYVTHLGTDVTDHASQVGELLLYTSRRAGPKIVAGDFNFIPTDAQHAVMGVHYKDPLGTELQPYTFNATRPTKRLDYLWGNPQVRFSQTGIISTQAADHFPFVSNVTLDFSTGNYLNR